MSSITAVLYTTFGGVLGAGLTQYVTHVRDRRTARASVIECIYEVEAVVLGLRWPEDVPTEEVKGNYVSLEKLLAKLESACLIAGIPRAPLALYATSCRIYGGASRCLSSMDEMLLQTE